MRRNIKLIALFNFFTDFKFYSAVLIIYFVRITGSYTLAMSLFSVAMVASALFEIPTGVFSDMIGRKNTVVCGAISAILYAIFYAIGTSYWILFVGAVIEGLSRSWYSGNNDALLHDSLREVGQKEKFAHYLGKTGSMFQIALMVGAVIGSIIANWSFSLIMWLSIIPQICCFIISLFLKEPKKISEENTNIFSHIRFSAIHLWKNQTLRLISLQDIISFGISEAKFDFSAAFITTLWPTWAIGLAKIISYTGAAISFWFSGKIIKKYSTYSILFFSTLYSKTVNFIAFLFPGFFSPILMGSTSIFYGVTQVGQNALEQKEYTDNQRATLGSLTSFLGSLFFGIFSLFLGICADRFGPAHTLVIAEICSLSVTYILWKLYTAHKYET